MNDPVEQNTSGLRYLRHYIHFFYIELPFKQCYYLFRVQIHFISRPKWINASTIKLEKHYAFDIFIRFIRWKKKGTRNDKWPHYNYILAQSRFQGWVSLGSKGVINKEIITDKPFSAFKAVVIYDYIVYRHLSLPKKPDTQIIFKRRLSSI